ncbi:MAG: cobalamin biosynthesis protein [Burkholderiaceae bacterium]
MGFLSLLLALLLEQIRPLHRDQPLRHAIDATSGWADRFLHAADQPVFGIMAWVAVAGGWSLLTWTIWWLARSLIGELGGLVSIGALYLTLGFRQFGRRFTDIQVALSQNRLEQARNILQSWKQQTEPSFQASRLSREDVVRVCVEHALDLSYRHVFAVMFWFLVLPGPMGAVLYRVADYLSRIWNDPRHQGWIFGTVAVRLQRALDWLPARLTALSFAAAGNFDDASMLWRQYTRRPTGKSPRGVLVAVGLGALGVRFDSDTAAADVTTVDSGAGLVVDTTLLATAVGLIWRSLMIWMGLLLLITVAGLIR